MSDALRTILFVHQGHELYGSDRVLLQSIEAVRQKWPAAKITVALPRTGPLYDALQASGQTVEIEKMFVLRKSDLKRVGPLALAPVLWRTFAAARRMDKYDLVYINTSVILDYLLASRLSRGKTIIHVHELPTGISRHLFSLFISLSRGDLVFISEAVRAAFRVAAGRRSTIVWNGSKARPALPAAGPRNELRILLPGRYNSWKGQVLLLEAIAKLRPEQRDRIKARLLGGVFDNQDHFSQEIAAKIEQLDLRGVAEMAPFTSDPSEHYAWSDIVAVPSTKPEPFGLVAIEGMAWGRPVIAANHGGLREIVVNGETGTLFTPGDSEALSRAIATYLDQPARIAQDGTNGRARFDAHFEESRYKAGIAAACAAALRS